MINATVDVMSHECTVNHAAGRQITSRDQGRTWTMPWYTVAKRIVPKRVIVSNCPFCGLGFQPNDQTE